MGWGKGGGGGGLIWGCVLKSGSCLESHSFEICSLYIYATEYIVLCMSYFQIDVWEQFTFCMVIDVKTGCLAQ